MRQHRPPPPPEKQSGSYKTIFETFDAFARYKRGRGGYKKLT
jgi:hypothetical protein